MKTPREKRASIEEVETSNVDAKFSVGGEMLARSPMGSVQDLSISSEQDFVLSDIEIESKINPKDNGQKNILNESENGSKVEINITTPEGTVKQGGEQSHAQFRKLSNNLYFESLQETVRFFNVYGTLNNFIKPSVKN